MTAKIFLIVSLVSTLILSGCKGNSSETSTNVGGNTNTGQGETPVNDTPTNNAPANEAGYTWNFKFCMFAICSPRDIQVESIEAPPIACTSANVYQLVRMNNVDLACLPPNYGSETGIFNGIPTATYFSPKKIELLVDGVIRTGSFKRGELIKGRIVGYSDKDASYCFEAVGQNSGCGLSSFVGLPNLYWRLNYGRFEGGVGTNATGLYRVHANNSKGEHISFTYEVTD